MDENKDSGTVLNVAPAMPAAADPVHAVYGRYPVQPRVKKTVPVGAADFILLPAVFLAAALFVRFSFFGGFNFGFTVSYAVLLAVAVYAAAQRKTQYSSFPVFCGALALLLSVPFTLYCDDAMKFVSFCGIGLLTVFFLGGLSGSLKCDDGSYMLCADMIKIMAVYPFRHYTLFADSVRSGAAKGTEQKINKLTYVFWGVLIAVPLVAVVAVLLYFSDAAFEAVVRLVFKNITNTLISGFFGALITAVLFPALFSLRKGVERADGKNRTHEKLFAVSGTLINTVLILLSACYVMYLLSQTAYFFSAFRGLLPEDFTAAAYARRGFFEMCAVVFINLAVFCAAYVLTKREEENGSLKGLTKGLLTFLSLFTIVFITTAFSKMYLYVDRFGLTRPRLLASVFMGLLFLLVVTMLLRLYIHKLPYMKIAVVLTAVLLLGVTFCDIDTQIARVNTYMYETGRTKTVDMDTLGALSAAKVPYILKLYKSDDPAVRVCAGYYLVNCIIENGSYNADEDTWSFGSDNGFIGYNVTTERAKKQLVTAYEEIKKDSALYDAYFHNEVYNNAADLYTGVFGKDCVSPKGKNTVCICALERNYSNGILSIWHDGAPIWCVDHGGDVYFSFYDDTTEENIATEWKNEDTLKITVTGQSTMYYFVVDLKTNTVTDTSRDIPE